MFFAHRVYPNKGLTLKRQICTKLHGQKNTISTPVDQTYIKKDHCDMNCHAVLAIKSSLPITTTTKNSTAVHLPDIHVQLLEEGSPGVFAHAYPD